MNNYIVGLDLGTSKICMSVGKIDKNKEMQIVALSSVECVGISKSVVVNIENTASSIISCKEKVQRIIDLDISEVFVSIPASICELIRNKGIVAITSDDRDISPNDVERVLDAAKHIKIPYGLEVIGVEPQQFIVDGYENIKDPVGMSGNRLEVDAHIITIKSTIISNLVKSINKAGLSIKGFILEPVSLGKLLLKTEESNSGAVIIDVGSQITSVSYYKNDSLEFYDYIELGGKTITSDIALCLKLPFSESENIKINYGNLKVLSEKDDNIINVVNSYNENIEINEKFLNEVILSRVEEIILLSKERLLKNIDIEDTSVVVLTGGGIANIDGSLELLKYIFNKPARIGTSSYVGATNPSYATSVSIVKDVFEGLKLQKLEFDVDSEDENLTFEKRVKMDNIKKINENFVSRIKGFIEDFF
ncbi:MAG: cell division protein FtsA [Clostridiaceae bacterium]